MKFAPTRELPLIPSHDEDLLLGLEGEESHAPIAECAGSAKSARSDAGARDALAAGIRHKNAAQPRCAHVQLPHTMDAYGRAVRG